MEGNKQKTEISEIDIAALFYKLYLKSKKNIQSHWYRYSGRCSDWL